MPERKQILREKTYAQGDDSWIEYEPFSIGERFNSDRQLTTREETTSRIKRWNWVDKDNIPLPQPEDEPEIFNAISTYEMSCLINVVFGFPDENDVKN